MGVGIAFVLMHKHLHTHVYICVDVSMTQFLAHPITSDGLMILFLIARQGVDAIWGELTHIIIFSSDPCGGSAVAE